MYTTVKYKFRQGSFSLTDRLGQWMVYYLKLQESAELLITAHQKSSISSFMDENYTKREKCNLTFKCARDMNYSVLVITYI